MTCREIELLALCIKYAKAYDDSNPDMGMSPSYRMIAENVVGRLRFDVSSYDIDLAIDLIMEEKQWEY